LGHVRVPFARDLPDHRPGIELATIDAHRAAEAAADIKGRLRARVGRGRGKSAMPFQSLILPVKQNSFGPWIAL
jgi:hypothetical protein